jgi:hypothetical protein
VKKEEAKNGGCNLKDRKICTKTSATCAGLNGFWRVIEWILSGS